MQLQLMVVQQEQVSAVFEGEKKWMLSCDYHLKFPGLLKRDPDSERDGKSETVKTEKGRIKKGWQIERGDYPSTSSMEQHWPLLANKPFLSVFVTHHQWLWNCFLKSSAMWVRGNIYQAHWGVEIIKKKTQSTVPITGSGSTLVS